jgi:hypothetical protein
MARPNSIVALNLEKTVLLGRARGDTLERIAIARASEPRVTRSRQKVPS